MLSRNEYSQPSQLSIRSYEQRRTITYAGNIGYYGQKYDYYSRTPGKNFSSDSAATTLRKRNSFSVPSMSILYRSPCYTSEKLAS